MRTFAVVNQKGGCGKTTTAINLAGVFASRGFRTLLVDMDPQGHCAAGLAIPEQRVDLHIGDAMLAPDEKPVDPARLLWRVMRNLDLAPSTLRLAALEASRGELAGRPDAEHRLKKVLARFDGQYDICLIDCSPAIGMLAFNALVAADDVLIPVETGFFSLQGASKQINTIKSLGKRLGVAPVHRLLATIHDPSSVLAQDLLEELRRRFGSRVIPVVIRQDQALREAASFGQPVIEYSRESIGAQDYGALADWLGEHALHAGGARDVDLDAPLPQTPPQHSPQAAPQVTRQPAATPIAQPAATVRTSAAIGEVHIVPGVTQLAIAGVMHSARRQKEAAQIEASLGVSAPAPVIAAPAAAPVSEAPPVERQKSRAADVVARTRRVQSAAEAFVGFPAAESKPARDVSSRREGPAAAAPEPGRTIGGEVDPFGPAPRSCGAHVPPAGVIFRQPLSIGKTVFIAGDFNSWSADATPLVPNAANTALESIVPLDPGTYQYRLVIDDRWVPDAFNMSVVPNPFGGSNSVITVPQRESTPGQQRRPA